MRRDDIHLAGDCRADFGRIDVFERSARRHELLPHHVRIAITSELFFEPIDGVAVSLRSLHPIAKLRQAFNVGFVFLQLEASHQATYRIGWRRRSLGEPRRKNERPNC